MLNKLKQSIGAEVQENVLLKKHTTFKIGGPAKYFVQVENGNELFKAVKSAVEFQLKYFILGGGSNVLVSDAGFDGLVIKLSGNEMKIENGRAQVFAGCNLMFFVRQCLKAGRGGLDFSANIPGTVGGAVRGNAGAYGQGVGDFVETVEAVSVENGEVGLKILEKEECEFAYRQSIFKTNPKLIVSQVNFVLPEVDNIEPIVEKIKNEMSERVAKQPWGKPSAGCSFMNLQYLSGMTIPDGWQTYDKIPAAKVVQELGLKGKKIGGAEISDKHANFIINTGDATARDVKQLIDLIKTEAKKHYGLEMREELQFVGDF